MDITQRNNEIIDLYINHLELSNEEIAKKYNVSTATISRIARLNNLPRRKGNSGVRLTIEQEKEIIQKYSTTKTSLLEIQKEYQISYDRLIGLLNKYECPVKTAAKRLNNNLNENYFSIIDSEDKAYWLGLIISDGAITNQPEKSKFQLEITLKQEDEHILHLLETDLQVENKVYTSAEIYKRFSLGSKQIIADLNQLGITQNKSFTVKIPNINPKFHASLIRGLFDGDGGFTVYTRSNGQKCQELSFCGNEYVIGWVLETLIKNIPTLSKATIQKESSIKRIRWSSKKDISLIRDYIYNHHNNHYLQRKYKLIYANTEVTE